MKKTPPPAVRQYCKILLAVLAFSATLAAQAADPVRYHFDIGEKSLLAALTEVTSITGVQIIQVSGAAISGQIRSLQGHYTLDQALQQLLQGQAVSWERVNEHVIRIGPALPSQVIQLDALEVRGQSGREAVYQTAGSVAVVTREEIDRLPPRNTADVLSGVAGVTTSQSRQNPGVSVNIRGMQDFGRVTVMLDGARQNFQKSGHGSNGIVYLDPELLAGVDVFKGPVSTTGGAGSLAGTVNFRTLNTDDLLQPDQKAGGRINLNTGDNGYDFAGSLAAAARFSEGFDMAAAISHKTLGDFDRGKRGDSAHVYDVHGPSQYTGQEQASALLKGNWRLGDAQSLSLGYVGLRAEFHESFQDSAMEGSLRGLNEADMDTLVLDYHLAPTSNPLLNLDASLYYTMTQVREQRMDATFYTDFDVSYKTSTVGGSLQNLSAVDLLGKPASLLYGTEFYYDWTHPSATSETAQDGNEKWFTGATPKGNRLAFSIFGEATVFLTEKLSATAGLRYDWYQLEGRGSMYSGSIANPPGVRPTYTRIFTDFEVQRHAGHLAPKLTLSHETRDWLQLYASYGEGIRPPAITESLLWGAHVGNMFYYYPNPGLDSERSHTWEVGANLNFHQVFSQHDSLQVKLAWFDTRVDNYMAQSPIMRPTDEVQPVGYGAFAFVNFKDEVRFRGLEVQADYDSGRVFSTLAYTRQITDLGDRSYDAFPLGSLYGYPQTSFGQDIYAGLWYVLPPRQRLVLDAGLRFHNQRLVLGARYHHEEPEENVGAGWLTDSVLDSMQTWDLWSSYQVNPNLVLRLSVNNLLDRYYTEQNGSAHQVGPGRTVIAGISIKF